MSSILCLCPVWTIVHEAMVINLNFFLVPGGFLVMSDRNGRSSKYGNIFCHRFFFSNSSSSVFPRHRAFAKTHRRNKCTKQTVKGPFDSKTYLNQNTLLRDLVRKGSTGIAVWNCCI